MTPVVFYTSAGMPVGSFAAISLYRVTPVTVAINGTNYSIATAPAAGGLAAGSTLLGVFLAEKAGIGPKGKLIRRMDAIGTPFDKHLLRDDPTLALTFQQASIGTPSLMPGDAMEIQIGMKASSTSASPAPIAITRWFIMEDHINYDSGDPTKFTVTFELDRQNSSANLVEF